MTAPIMLPFGFVWLLLAFCIAGYNSELFLDREKRRVIYRSGVVFHSWENIAEQGNVKRVVLKNDGGKYSFVMEVEKGEDLSVTTFDYWRSREWSERVANFLGLPLIDECRLEGDSEATDIRKLMEQEHSELTFPEVPPGIRFECADDRVATIWIPARGLLPSSRPRLLLGVLALLCGVAVFFFWTKYFLWGFIPGVSIILWGWGKPLVQATHREEIRVSSHGIHATITSFGRVYRKSLGIHQIHQVDVVKGGDARFLPHHFDRHAVCIEGPLEHLQLGANLPKIKQVEWLQQTLVYFLTRPG